MNYHRIQISKFLVCGFLLSLASCGVLTSSATNSEGAQDIGIDASIASFDATSNVTAVKSVPFKNATNNALTLYKVAFGGNICNTISYFGLGNSQSEMLQDALTVINYKVVPGGRVNILLQYTPRPCTVESYDVNLYTYFRDEEGKESWSQSIIRMQGKSTATEDDSVVGCPAPLEDDEFTALRFSTPPPAGEYYLKITALRAFIYPNSSNFAPYAQIIGTDIGDIDPPFDQPYLKTTVNADGTFTIGQIDVCSGFNVPSERTDQFFQGKNTRVTSTAAINGTVAKVDILAERRRETHIDALDINLGLFSKGLPDGSLIQEGGIFQIALETDLTTRALPESINLGEAFTTELNDRDLDNSTGQYFNVLKGKKEGTGILSGRPLINGSMTLVGVGKFFVDDDNPIIASDTAIDALINNEAFLYVTLSATIMERDSL